MEKRVEALINRLIGERIAHNVTFCKEKSNLADIEEVLSSISTKLDRLGTVKTYIARKRKGMVEERLPEETVDFLKQHLPEIYDKIFTKHSI